MLPVPINVQDSAGYTDAKISYYYMHSDLVDGASVYGYALQNPGRNVDPRGESIWGRLHVPNPKNSDAAQQCAVAEEECETAFEAANDLCRFMPAGTPQARRARQRGWEQAIKDYAGYQQKARDGENWEFKIVPPPPFFLPKRPNAQAPVPVVRDCRQLTLLRYCRLFHTIEATV